MLYFLYIDVFLINETLQSLSMYINYKQNAMRYLKYTGTRYLA